MNAVEKALHVIECVGGHGSRSFAEIAEDTGLPRSTLHRLLSSAVNAGYLEHRPRGEYAVTTKLWTLGLPAVSPKAQRGRIVAVLRELASDTGESAHFSIYDRGEAVYVEKEDGLHPIQAYTFVGGRSPAYATATGKALLSCQSDEEIERVGAAVVPHTPTTIRSVEELKEQMALTRELGFAVNHGEWREGAWGVAAPLPDHFEDVLGAIGISGPRDRIEPLIPELGELITRHAGVLRPDPGEPTSNEIPPAREAVSSK